MNSLKFYRLHKNLTVKEMANLLGISPSTYSYVERGEITASEEVVEKISEILGTPKEVIFFPTRFGIRELKGVEYGG